VREADARVDAQEAEARDRAEMSRMRQIASISERAKHVAELERTRVAEGFYDPQRLARMQDERKVNPNPAIYRSPCQPPPCKASCLDSSNSYGILSYDAVSNICNAVPAGTRGGGA